MAEQQHLTAVVCRNHGQFRNWCYDNGFSPRDPSLRLVLNEQHARGYEFDDVILVDGPSALMEATQARLRRRTNA